jgi:hypothetical protein
MSKIDNNGYIYVYTLEDKWICYCKYEKYEGVPLKEALLLDFDKEGSITIGF